MQGACTRSNEQAKTVAMVYQSFCLGLAPSLPESVLSCPSVGQSLGWAVSITVRTQRRHLTAGPRLPVQTHTNRQTVCLPVHSAVKLQAQSHLVRPSRTWPAV